MQQLNPIARTYVPSRKASRGRGFFPFERWLPHFASMATSALKQNGCQAERQGCGYCPISRSREGRAIAASTIGLPGAGPLQQYFFCLPRKIISGAVSNKCLPLHPSKYSHEVEVCFGWGNFQEAGSEGRPPPEHGISFHQRQPLI